jgi:hypothetical protein
MIDTSDRRFQELVRRAAPAGRDPAFRLNVIERRERQRLRQGAVLSLSLAVAIVGLAGVAAVLRPAPLFADGAALFALTGCAALLLRAPALLGALRRLRL